MNNKSPESFSNKDAASKQPEPDASFFDDISDEQREILNDVFGSAEVEVPANIDTSHDEQNSSLESAGDYEFSGESVVSEEESASMNAVFEGSTPAPYKLSPVERTAIMESARLRSPSLSIPESAREGVAELITAFDTKRDEFLALLESGTNGAARKEKERAYIEARNTLLFAVIRSYQIDRTIGRGEIKNGRATESLYQNFIDEEEQVLRTTMPISDNESLNLKRSLTEDALLLSTFSEQLLRNAEPDEQSFYQALLKPEFGIVEVGLGKGGTERVRALQEARLARFAAESERAAGGTSKGLNERLATARKVYTKEKAAIFNEIDELVKEQDSRDIDTLIENAKAEDVVVEAGLRVQRLSKEKRTRHAPFAALMTAVSGTGKHVRNAIGATIALFGVQVAGDLTEPAQPQWTYEQAQPGTKEPAASSAERQTSYSTEVHRHGAAKSFEALLSITDADTRARLMEALHIKDGPIEQQAFVMARDLGFMSSLREDASRRSEAGDLLTSEDLALIRHAPDPGVPEGSFHLENGGRKLVFTPRGGEPRVLLDTERAEPIERFHE